MVKLTVFFLIISCFGFGQNPELIVQTGHSAKILDVTFSPDNNYILSCSEDKRIIVWDRETQKQYGVLEGHQGPVTALAFTGENKDQVISASLDGRLIEWNFITGEIIRETRVSSPIASMVYHQPSQQFILGGINICTIAKDFSGLTTHVISGAESDFSMGSALLADVTCNNDASQIAFTDARGVVGVIDLNNSENSIVVSKNNVSAVQFAENDKYLNLLYANGKLTQDNPHTFRIKHFKSIFNRRGVQKICKNDPLWIGTKRGDLINLTPKGFFVKQKLAIHKTSVVALSKSQNGKLILSADAAGQIVVTDLEQGNANEIYEGKINRIDAISFSPDGKIIFAAYRSGLITGFNLKTFETYTFNELVNEKYGDRVNYKIAKIEVKDNELLITYLKTRQSRELQWMYDYVREYQAVWQYENATKASEVNPIKDGLYEKDFMKKYNGRQNLMTGSPETPFAMNLILENDQLRATLNNQSIDMTKGGTSTFFHKHSDVATTLAYNPAGDFLATASWDGAIKFWNYHTGELKLQLFLMGDKHFAFVTPENNYFSSKEGMANINFKYNQEMYAFEQFDLLYNRPDLVFERIQGVVPPQMVQNFEKAYHKRLAKLNVKPSELTLSKRVPECVMEINNLADMGKFGVKLTVDSKGSALKKLHVLVNGVPEYGAAGLNITNNLLDTTVAIQLESGNNSILSYVTTVNGLNSLKEIAVVNVADYEVQKNLYVIGVGVSKFKQDQYDLKYAAKDAKDVLSYYSQNTSFQNVYTKKLLDNDVTLNKVNELSSFLSNVTPQDVVVFYAAGHGVLSADLDFYFAAHDMDFDDPSSKGIPYDLFENILEACPSRHKCLFLDACHSGEIDKEEVELALNMETEDGEIQFRNVGAGIEQESQGTFELSRTLFADMRPNHGINIVSSAGGAEFAMEGKEWNNGVFTYAFLNGMKDNHADLNNDQHISLSEIRSYVFEQVKILTSGRQIPTSRTENRYNDFKIN